MNNMTFRITTQGYVIECEKYTYTKGEVTCYNGGLKKINIKDSEWFTFLELYLDLSYSEYMIVDYAPFE